MLTIKECARAVRGVSEHSIRQIVAQGRVKSIRTGEGKRGKILVNKADLMAYFGA
jgi:excisionase family DNA binding protein